MKNPSLRRLVFACGASYEITNDPPLNRLGGFARLLVQAQGSPTPIQPKLDGQPMSCLWHCPAKVRASQRLEQKAWFGEAAKVPTGDPVRCVLCRPTHVEVA